MELPRCLSPLFLSFFVGFSAIIVIIKAQSNISYHYRLPTHAIPVRYNVTLEPNFETFSFTGSVDIEINVLEESSNITLNAYGLEIDSHNSTLSSPGQSITPNVSYDEKNQFLFLEFGTNLSTGTYLIHLEYVGRIYTDVSLGLYRSAYLDKNGALKWFLVTQFATTFARRVLPCFDEPAYKASFVVNIIRSSDYNSISNMKISATRPFGEKYVDTFEETVKMSTYLLAFVISDYTTEENGTQAVYARDEMISDGRGILALEAGTSLLRILEDYMNISYPLDKMYQVAINDSHFRFGAMENWGLVTYKESLLLYKENVTTKNEELGIVKIIAHEFTHQWFGNLVTPKWWDNIWLNEGFATYFEWYATSIYKPEWRMLDLSVVRSVQAVLEEDDSESTKPMTTDSETIVELMDLFSTIAYNKAGAVIRMLAHVISLDVFQQGLNIYLQNMSYSNSVPSDLWNGIQAALEATNPSGDVTDGKSVESIMEPWTSQSGYPVVNVERNYSTNTITLSQSRFVLTNATHNLTERWPIPINYASSADFDFTNTSVMLWLSDETMLLEGNFTSSFLIFNKQQTGYYRVNYDSTTWLIITYYLRSSNFERIHVLNRAQLISDALSLAQSGRLNYTIVLDLLEYVVQETDYIPHYSLNRGLQYLNRILAGTAVYQQFKRFVIEILQGAYTKLGTDLIENEHIFDVLNREAIIYWMCLYGNENCLASMNTKLSAHSEWVAPDLQSSVYCAGMRNGSESDWNYLYEKYISQKTEYTEKKRLFTGLGCTLNEVILGRLLNASLGLDSNYGILTSDASAFTLVYTGSDVGLSVAFNFVLSHFAEINERFTPPMVATFIRAIASRLTNVDQREKLQTFVDSQSNETKELFETTFSVALASVDNNLNWLDRNKQVFQSWLDAREAATTTVTQSSSTETSSGTTQETTTTTGCATDNKNIRYNLLFIILAFTYINLYQCFFIS